MSLLEIVGANGAIVHVYDRRLAAVALEHVFAIGVACISPSSDACGKHVVCLDELVLTPPVPPPPAVSEEMTWEIDPLFDHDPWQVKYCKAKSDVDRRGTPHPNYKDAWSSWNAHGVEQAGNITNQIPEAAETELIAPVDSNDDLPEVEAVEKSGEDEDIHDVTIPGSQTLPELLVPESPRGLPMHVNTFGDEFDDMADDGDELDLNDFVQAEATDDPPNRRRKKKKYKSQKKSEKKDLECMDELAETPFRKDICITSPWLEQRCRFTIDEIIDIAKHNHDDATIRLDWLPEHMENMDEQIASKSLDIFQKSYRLLAKVKSWNLIACHLDSTYAGMPVLLDRETEHFEECSIGVLVKMLPGHVALVALTTERKSRKARLGILPIELLLLPSLDDSDNEHLFR